MTLGSVREYLLGPVGEFEGFWIGEPQLFFGAQGTLGDVLLEGVSGDQGRFAGAGRGLSLVLVMLLLCGAQSRSPASIVPFTARVGK